MVGLRSAAIAMCFAAATLATTAETTNSTETVAARQLARAPVYQVCGMDLVGGDQKSVQFYTQNGCTTICDEPNAPCNAVSWTNYNGGTCWLKILSEFNAFPSLKINPGATAFFRQGQISFPSYPVAMYDGYDMAGNDIGSRRGTQGDCQSDCVSNSKCFGYVWTNYEGGTCWFKSKANTLVPKAGAFSALFARSDAGWYACRDLY